MSFLKAEWRKIIFANYIVDPKFLLPYLPDQTELDTWNNQVYVSLVGFMFKNTKILGIKIPFHTNFEEVNLRFYVRHKNNNEWKRGVVFIKEIVPKWAITFVAITFYNENYETRKMQHNWKINGSECEISYDWYIKNIRQSLNVNAANESAEISIGSEEEFITEHYWGYAKRNSGGTNEYEVKHPKWKCYPINNYNINVDFELNYGPDFAFLNNEKPTTVMLAEGSEITVERKKIIR